MEKRSNPVVTKTCFFLLGCVWESRSRKSRSTSSLCYGREWQFVCASLHEHDNACCYSQCAVGQKWCSPLALTCHLGLWTCDWSSTSTQAQQSVCSVKYIYSNTACTYESFFCICSSQVFYFSTTSQRQILYFLLHKKYLSKLLQ